MNGPLTGRFGIVTGGGKGLGRAFALSLAAAGAGVVVNNRNRQVDSDGRGPADHVVEEIRAAGGSAVAQYSDVADPDAVADIVDTAMKHHGRIDFLVTSAGVSAPEMFHKTTPERFDTVTGITACAALMRTARFGRIVLIASTAGLHGEPTASAYSASKGAVIALGRAIAVEGAARNVLTNVVLPYATTQMTDAGMHSDYRETMAAAAVAPLVTALVDPLSAVNGQIIVAGGGAIRVASAVEWGAVALPTELTPESLTSLLEQSREGPARSFDNAEAAFLDFAESISGLDR